MKHLLRIIPFLLLLLFLPSAQASTLEIEALRSIHKKAQADRYLPIRENDRKTALSDLNRASMKASKSSDLLLKKSSDAAKKKARQAEGDANRLAARKFEEIRGIYEAEQEKIKQWSSDSIRLTEKNYKAEVAAINREAMNLSVACSTAQCRRNVESWRRATIETAGVKRDKMIKIIDDETRRRITVIKEIRTAAEQEARAERGRALRKIERDLQNEEASLQAAHRERATLIKYLTDDTRDIIRGRCSLDQNPSCTV